MSDLDGFDKKQLHLITWAQTGLIAVMMVLITVLAGFWASAMKEGQTELNLKFDKLFTVVNDLRISDAKQSEINEQQTRQLQKLWDTHRSQYDPAPLRSTPN